VVVLSNLPAAIDPDVAARLRAGGVPVLEGTRTGLLALGHLLNHGLLNHGLLDHGRLDHGRPQPGAATPLAPVPAIDAARRARWTALLAAGQAGGAALAGLLRDYGIAVARSRSAVSEAGALAAAAELGYPVVLKTDEPGIAHKSDAGGVVLGLAGPAALTAAYQDLAERLGRRVLVCETIPAGPELALGLARDHELGPLLVVGAGGVLVELLADRAVALPPVGPEQARAMLSELRVAALLAGARGQPAADVDAVVAAVTGLSQLAAELGDALEALDINPLICGPHGAVAVDALAIPRQGRHPPAD
jgi:acetate---CoA ligase (ADP-forming)